MPDDYFNQQQQQRAPRYAAGSDMDSITTGQEIRYSNDGNGGKILIIAAVIILALSIVLTSHGSKEPEVETQDEQLTGEVQISATEIVPSADRKKVMIQATIDNGTNKEIYNIEVTYSVLNEEQETIVEKTVTLSENLLASESTDHTEIIDIPDGYENEKLYITTGLHCKHRS